MINDDYQSDIYNDEDIEVAYCDFAYVYDRLMDNVPYGEWADSIERLISEYGVSKPVRAAKNPDGQNAGSEDDSSGSNYAGEPTEEEVLESERNLVLDLGCGTGNLTELMYEKGFDMIGIDLSEDMLQVARDKSFEKNHDILYLNQDMRVLDLYSTIGTVICVCDSINYLTEAYEIVDVMKLIRNYLFPGGIFIFDFNTVHKYQDVIGEKTISESREELSFIWDNYYDCETKLNEYDLTVFTLIEKPDIYRRFDETHIQRGYTYEEMLSFLEEAGLTPVYSYDADTNSEVDSNSERICIVAKKICS